MTSQWCYKLLYLQIALLMSHQLYGPYGYVDHSIVYTKRNEGIQGSLFPPWSIQVCPCSGCRSQGHHGLTVVCLPSWKPLLLPDHQILLLVAASPAPFPWRRILSLQCSMSITLSRHVLGLSYVSYVTPLPLWVSHLVRL